jgi:hypothetical protein
MKPKPKSRAKPAARPNKAAERKRSTVPSTGGRWRTSDLPAEQQAELRSRLEEAKRGENLFPFDEAVDEAERMADEIVDILNRPDGRHPAE